MADIFTAAALLLVALGVGLVLGYARGKQVGWADCWRQLGRDESDEQGA